MSRHEPDVEAGLLEDREEKITLLQSSATHQPVQPPNTALLRRHSDQEYQGPLTGQNESTAEEKHKIVVLEDCRDEDELDYSQTGHSPNNNVLTNEQRYGTQEDKARKENVSLTSEDVLATDDSDKKEGENIEQEENIKVTGGADHNKGEFSEESRNERITGEAIRSKFKNPTRKLYSSANSVDIDDTSGTTNDALHKAALAQDTATLRRLIAAGASVGELDSAGRTALHLCIEHKLLEPFKVLLSVEGATEVLDSRGLPVLHVAVRHCWRAGVQAALAAGADITAIRPNMTEQEIQESCQSHLDDEERMPLDYFYIYPQTAIHVAVASGDMVMLDEILTVAEQRGYINCHNLLGKTPLYTAIEFGYLEAIKLLLKRGASVHLVSNRKESALHVATICGRPDILQYLLDTTDATLTPQMFHQTPIQLAALLNQATSLELLIDKFGVENLKDRSNLALQIAVSQGNMEAIEVILNKCADTINLVNDDGDTALHVAITEGRRDIVVLLLKRGAHLSAKGSTGITAIEMIATKFYNPTDFFILVFDEFIYNNNEFDVYWLDYDVLNIEGVSQIKVLEEFVRCNQSSVLKHPFIESLLYLKWRQLLPIFYCMIVLFSIFLVTFNIFVINMFSFKDTKDEITVNDSLTSKNEMWYGVNDGWYWLLIMLIYLSICLLFVQELFDIILKRLHYFTRLESWVKLGGLTLGTLVPAVAGIEADWPRHVACAAVLLSWLQAMFLLARFPQWGNYVLMFGKVATNIFKIFVTTIFLVLGFSFCFMIQYRSVAPFDGPFAAFDKTLIMMSSEFDYENLLGENHDKELHDSRTVVRLLFLLFVIFVAIVLMNFIIGIAVSDINELNMTSKIRALEKQLQLLSTLDVLSNTKALTKLCKTMRRRKYHYIMEFSILISGRNWTVSTGVKSEFSKNRERYELHIPSTLSNAIIDIAKNKKQRTEEDSMEKATRKKIDAMYDAVVDSSNKKDQTDLKNRNDLSLPKQEMKRQNKQTKSLAERLTDVQQVIKSCLKERNDFGLLQQELKRQNEQIKLLADRLTDVQQEIKSCNQKLENDMAIIKEMLIKK